MATILRRGGINWEPPYPEGEDEASLQKHKEFLQNEWVRRCPDKEKIKKRMALTFPDRRRRMNQKISLVELRAEYPALFHFDQVLSASSIQTPHIIAATKQEKECRTVFKLL